MKVIILKHEISFKEWMKKVHPLTSADDRAIAHAAYGCSLTLPQTNSIISALHARRERIAKEGLAEKSEYEILKWAWKDLLMRSALTKDNDLENARRLDMDSYDRFIKKLSRYRRLVRAPALRHSPSIGYTF